MSGVVRRPSRPPRPCEPILWSPAGGPARLSAAWITNPRIGELVSGDTVVMREHGASVLIAVVDALGHGPKAAEVAQASSEWLGRAEGDGVPAIMQGLHGALQGSRGAAALVLLLSERGLEACSVGNVELRSSTGRLPFVLTPGVLGVRLRQPKVSFARAPIAERFILFSDGISGRFDLKSLRDRSASEAAAHIFASHRHDHDDATVVVIDVA